MNCVCSNRVYHSQSGLTVCGGYKLRTTCFKFENGQWNHLQDMQYGRGSHLSWLKPNGEIVLLGGYADEDQAINYNTTEVVNWISQEPFSLKYPVRYGMT